MARVFPDGWRELAATGAAGRELQTLAQLAAGLEDAYTVFNGVHRTPVERGDYAIVDQGQDFHEGWAANLMPLLQPGGRASTTCSVTRSTPMETC